VKQSSQFEFHMLEEPTKEPANKSSISAKIIDMAPIIAALAGVLGLILNLPSTRVKILVALLALVFLALVLYLLGRLLKYWIEVRRCKRIIRKHSIDFDSLVDSMEELLTPNRCDNIPYIFTHLRDIQNAFANDVQSLMYDVSSLFTVFRQEVNRRPKNKENFLLFLKWFESILEIYDKQLIRKPLEQIKHSYKEKITDSDRQDYEKNRDIYVDFINNYKRLAKSINRDIGERVVREYFETPNKL